ncbi:MAG: FkbM family methyltransferase [Candidatus Methylacidiphilales bacterium]
MLETVLDKISNLCDILRLPGGLSAKLTEQAYSRADLALCYRLKRAGIVPGSILDVGANIGQFALSATLTWPGVPIVSFEPLPDAFASLSTTARRHPAITPVRLALSDAPGETDFHVTNQTQSSSLLPLGRRHLDTYQTIRETGTIRVTVSTLSAELPKHPGPPPRLLKLDVQGAESRVLAGGGISLKEFQWILLETATSPMYEGEVTFDDISRQLQPLGFRFETPVHIHLSPSGTIGQFDALFTRQA